LGSVVYDDVAIVIALLVEGHLKHRLAGLLQSSFDLRLQLAQQGRDVLASHVDRMACVRGLVHSHPKTPGWKRPCRSKIGCESCLDLGGMLTHRDHPNACHASGDQDRLEQMVSVEQAHPKRYPASP
jgi:hypothetical protein